MRLILMILNDSMFRKAMINLAPTWMIETYDSVKAASSFFWYFIITLKEGNQLLKVIANAE